jgi:hypothetical protein
MPYGEDGEHAVDPSLSFNPTDLISKNPTDLLGFLPFQLLPCPLLLPFSTSKP